jgi:hypothetical protein
LHGAGAAKSGTLVFSRFGSVDDGTGEWGQIEVNAYSIDDLAEQLGTPDVLFIDVEGFECEVLRGGQRTLATKPDCFVEVDVNAGLEKFGGSVEPIFSLFPEGMNFLRLRRTALSSPGTKRVTWRGTGSFWWRSRAGKPRSAAIRFPRSVVRASSMS